jgi:osmotically-inducible protein OsmY
MKTLNAALTAALLATAAGAGYAAAPTAALNHDPAIYRNLTQKANADYQAAVAKCNAMKGNDQDVCTAEAKLARVRAENEALARYNNSPKGREKARTDVADAEYAVAKARCGAKTGADKDDCLNNAKSVHTAAVADAKADRPGSAGNDQSAAAAPTVVEKTKEVAHEVAEKTKQAAAALVRKTENALDRNGGADKADDKADNALGKANNAAADTAITAKVKAGLVKERDLESLGIHVETEKGVVMLSGFVNSKAEADKAVQVAKGVDGVANVRSAIKVK